MPLLGPPQTRQFLLGPGRALTTASAKRDADQRPGPIYTSRIYSPYYYLGNAGINTLLPFVLRTLHPYTVIYTVQSRQVIPQGSIYQKRMGSEAGVGMAPGCLRGPSIVTATPENRTLPLPPPFKLPELLIRHKLIYMVPPPPLFRCRQ